MLNDLNTDSENDDSVSRDSSFHIGSSGLGQLLVCRRDLHGLRVDEGEEENVGAGLLVLVQARLPVGVRLKALVVVVGKKDVDSHHLKNKKDKLITGVDKNVGTNVNR
jgi:hypothetical protein